MLFHVVEQFGLTPLHFMFVSTNNDSVPSFRLARNLKRLLGLLNRVNGIFTKEQVVPCSVSACYVAQERKYKIFVES